MTSMAANVTWGLSPETTIGFVGALALAVAAIYGFMRWFLSGPAQPDPWDAQIADAISEPGVQPLCHRCLTPNDPEADFCSECGATIGQYTNWLPYPYIFSLGHTLRIGTAGEFRRSPLTVFGFLLLPLAEYAIFAPIYWIIFLLHLPSRKTAGNAGTPPISTQ